MIEFEQKEWFDKADSRAIPLTHIELNRMEDGIKKSVDGVNKIDNDLYNHWWRKSEIIGGAEEHQSLGNKSFYCVVGDTESEAKESVFKIYYAEEIDITVNNVTGNIEVLLKDENSIDMSYNGLGGATKYDLQKKYFLIGTDVYYAPSTYTRTYNSTTKQCGIIVKNAIKVVPSKVYGNIEYISSENANEYASGWNSDEAAMYEYLGIPIEKAKTSISMSTGWYFGNGFDTRKIDIGKTIRYAFVWRDGYMFANDSTYFGVACETFTEGNEIFIDGSELDVSNLNTSGTQYFYIVFTD